jgi:hypothetical protein
MYIVRRQSKVMFLKALGSALVSVRILVQIQLFTHNLDPGPGGQNNADPDLDPAVTNG